ncbi:xaa-Pro dipeptidase-like [Apostichopus japonicus]|uniref:xaa-Pro dipeptidase-like n=1 Tax=Stichopus japonicus TaxID=307972 RepID=UPI003AB545F7
MAEVAKPEFSRGPASLTISVELHVENRKRLCSKLKKIKEVPEGAIIFLKGGEEELRNDTDVGPVFRQESYFHWAFGVEECGFFGAIAVDSGNAVLFCPELPKEYAVWLGKILPREHFQQRYAVDDVCFINKIADWFAGQKPSVILTLKGKNTDSGNYAEEATFTGIDKFTVNNSLLFPEIVECRVFKTAKELEILRYVCRISSEAHIEVMRKIKPGMKEFQIESMFQHYCYYNGGCRHTSYTCICASGANAAILHYGHAGEPNSRTMEAGDICNFDMGGEYYCYASDITCAYPVNGKFTDQQKKIYNTVLKANQAVFNAVKPGVLWTDMHLLAEKVILEELTSHGLLKGDISEMQKVNVGALFFPHGLGHLMGIDVHDVGGYPEGGNERSTLPGLKYLRTARVLEADMVLTIEPGCYFIESILEEAMSDEKYKGFLCPDVIRQYLKFGGIRIEDDVVITKNGAELLNHVPRTVEEIESVMAGGKFTKI